MTSHASRGAVPPRLQQRLFEVLEAPPAGDRVGRAVNRFLLWLIVANIAAVVLESVGALQARYRAGFHH